MLIAAGRLVALALLLLPPSSSQVLTLRRTLYVLAAITAIRPLTHFIQGILINIYQKLSTYAIPGPSPFGTVAPVIAATPWPTAATWNTALQPSTVPHNAVRDGIPRKVVYLTKSSPPAFQCARHRRAELPHQAASVFSDLEASDQRAPYPVLSGRRHRCAIRPMRWSGLHWRDCLPVRLHLHCYQPCVISALPLRMSVTNLTCYQLTTLNVCKPKEACARFQAE